MQFYEMLKDERAEGYREGEANEKAKTLAAEKRAIAAEERAQKAELELKQLKESLHIQ